MRFDLERNGGFENEFEFTADAYHQFFGCPAGERVTRDRNSGSDRLFLGGCVVRELQAFDVLGRIVAVSDIEVVAGHVKAPD
jgi:hypothetical protein